MVTDASRDANPDSLVTAMDLWAESNVGGHDSLHKGQEDGIMKGKGLEQPGARAEEEDGLAEVCRSVVSDNPAQVAKFAQNTRMMAFFVGEVTF
jgi:Asp-tRNA(Asn)/Glu-tRNA(Gln) amidotransferase B subunit